MEMFKEIYDEYEHVGLYDICIWWIEKYPDDIFIKEPKEVVEIRELMKEILNKRKPHDSASQSANAEIIIADKSKSAKIDITENIVAD